LSALTERNDGEDKDKNLDCFHSIDLFTKKGNKDIYEKSKYRRRSHFGLHISRNEGEEIEIEVKECKNQYFERFEDYETGVSAMNRPFRIDEVQVLTQFCQNRHGPRMRGRKYVICRADSIVSGDSSVSGESIVGLGDQKYSFSNAVYEKEIGSRENNEAEIDKERVAQCAKRHTILKYPISGLSPRPRAPPLSYVFPPRSDIILQYPVSGLSPRLRAPHYRIFPLRDQILVYR
jgi:hypothetical protein